MSFKKNKKGVDRNDDLFIFLTIIVIVGTFFLHSTGALTGFAVSTFEYTRKVVINEHYADDYVIDINLNDLKRISLTGKYVAEQGDEARIYVETDKGIKLLLAEVQIEEKSTSSISPFTARATGQLQEENSTNDYDVVEADGLFVKDFEKICSQTCDLMKTSITKIMIEVDGGELFLKELNYVQKTQRMEEELIMEVENILLEIGEKKTVNAAEYFEGKNLVYGAKPDKGYSFTVSGDEIVFEGLKKGTWDSLLYALEGEAVIISNNFNIIVSGDKYVPRSELDEEEAEDPLESDDAKEEKKELKN